MVENPYLLELEYLKSIPVNLGEFHSHYNYEIFYFHEGKGSYILGDKIHSLSPGSMILMNGITLHSPIFVEGCSYVRTIISFDPTYIKEALSYLFAHNPIFTFEKLKNTKIQLDAEERHEFEHILANMNRFFSQNGGHSPDRFKVAFIDALFFIQTVSKKTPRKVEVLNSKNEQHVQSILGYIESHYMNDIDLDQLSKELHLNKYYLTRIFRELTGTTIFQYLYQRRINQAKIWLLIRPEESITDICYMTGFNNLSHFGKVFKKLEGTTPAQFRDSFKRQFQHIVGI